MLFTVSNINVLQGVIEAMNLGGKSVINRIIMVSPKMNIIIENDPDLDLIWSPAHYLSSFLPS